MVCVHRFIRVIEFMVGQKDKLLLNKRALHFLFPLVSTHVMNRFTLNIESDRVECSLFVVLRSYVNIW
jgi:hypothetical protein